MAGLNASLMRQYNSGNQYISENQLSKIEEAFNKIAREMAAIKLIWSLNFYSRGKQLIKHGKNWVYFINSITVHLVTTIIIKRSESGIIHEKGHYNALIREQKNKWTQKAEKSAINALLVAIYKNVTFNF